MTIYLVIDGQAGMMHEADDGLHGSVSVTAQWLDTDMCMALAEPPMDAGLTFQHTPFSLCLHRPQCLSIAILSQHDTKVTVGACGLVT